MVADRSKAFICQGGVIWKTFPFNMILVEEIRRLIQKGFNMNQQYSH
jgi:hypothetical protein